HPFIVQFFGAADLGDQVVIVLPFMRHGNLVQYLRNNPLADRHFLLLQVADAVCYLHESLGIVHGDLKCENVLVSDEGYALLTDFGLSTFIDKPESEATTMTDVRGWNTLRFAAPELLDDSARSATNRIRSKTPESDVYAFGMLILQVGIAAAHFGTYAQGCSGFQRQAPLAAFYSVSGRQESTIPPAHASPPCQRRCARS
ncbi:kinase-like protein, partial [Auricularia subglabra TFB-10046 SS5]